MINLIFVSNHGGIKQCSGLRDNEKYSLQNYHHLSVALFIFVGGSYDEAVVITKCLLFYAAPLHKYYCCCLVRAL